MAAAGLEPEGENVPNPGDLHEKGWLQRESHLHCKTPQHQGSLTAAPCAPHGPSPAPALPSRAQIPTRGAQPCTHGLAASPSAVPPAGSQAWGDNPTATPRSWCAGEPEHRTRSWAASLVGMGAERGCRVHGWGEGSPTARMVWDGTFTLAASPAASRQARSPSDVLKDQPRPEVTLAG